MRVNLALLDTPPVIRKAFKSAILDIRGKVLGCPISELLGGALKDRIPVTLCTGYKTVENTTTDAVWDGSMASGPIR